MTHITSYQPLPISFVKGDGVWLFDQQNKPYLDALAGISVTNLGHNHPEVTNTICQQAKELLHTSNIYHITYQEQLADMLCRAAQMPQVFFANSGAEANEAAIKIARLFGHQKNIDVPTIVVTDGAFHGRTMATLTATASPKAQAGFAPLVEGFTRVPFDDMDAMRELNDENIVAVMVEPIQGEGGIHIPSPDYLKQLRALCSERGWLLILDEIQTGMGRTGKLFAHEHSGIQPDIMTLAKALGNGVPIGACLIGSKAADLLQPGKHGSTFGGNPLATHTALTVLSIIGQKDFLTNAAAIGQALMTKLKARLSTYKEVIDIRGQGLMIGIELDRPARGVLQLALEEGLLINVTADKVIRLLPPLTLTLEEADILVQRLGNAIDKFLAS